MGSKGDVQVKMDEETRTQVSVLNQQVNKNKEKAMQRLLTLCALLNPSYTRISDCSILTFQDVFIVSINTGQIKYLFIRL